jgi:hypothetical protein
MGPRKDKVCELASRHHKELGGDMTSRHYKQIVNGLASRQHNGIIGGPASRHQRSKRFLGERWDAEISRTSSSTPTLMSI